MGLWLICPVATLHLDTFASHEKQDKIQYLIRMDYIYVFCEGSFVQKREVNKMLHWNSVSGHHYNIFILSSFFIPKRHI